MVDGGVAWFRGGVDGDEGASALVTGDVKPPGGAGGRATVLLVIEPSGLVTVELPSGLVTATVPSGAVTVVPSASNTSSS